MKIKSAILRTPLLRITSLNSVGLLLKIGMGLITSKVLAVFVGPAGIALVGNLRNFMSSVETVATLGFQNGIIKYAADAKSDQAALKQMFATTFYVLLGVSLLLGIFSFVCADWLNAVIFGTGQVYANIFRVLAFALPFYAGSVFLIAVTNGLGKFRQVIYTNIIGNMAGLIFSVYMVVHYHTLGALLSLVVPSALLFFVAFFYISKQLPVFEMLSFSDVRLPVFKGLLPYGLMALVSAVTGPLVYLALRNYIIERNGLEAAGFVEALNRLSGYYMLFISTLLTVYFLPKLTFAVTEKATKNVFLSYYKGVMPVFVAGLILLYLLRVYVVKGLFTDAFLPVADLFIWQFLGDLLKASALILGYQFFARKLTKAYIFTELFSFACMYLSGHWLIGIYGPAGFVMAHALSYALYLILLLVYFRRYLI